MGILTGTVHIVGEHVPIQRFMNGGIVCYLRQPLLVDGLTRLFLSHNSKDAVVEMFVKVLCIFEGVRARRALSCRVGTVVQELLRGTRARNPLTAIRSGLFDPVDCREMTFEHVCAIEAFLRRRTRTRAKSTDHRPPVVGEGVSILVVLSSEPLQVILAGHDRAFFWAFGLVRQHVRLEVLENASTVGIRASPFFDVFVFALEATGPVAVERIA